MQERLGSRLRSENTMASQAATALLGRVISLSLVIVASARPSTPTL